MEYRDYEDMNVKLCGTYKEIGQRKSYDAKDIEVIDHLTHAMLNIKRLEDYEMSDENSYGRYSRDGGRGGMWNAEGSYAGGMNDGTSNRSYAGGRMGTHYVGGHYSHGNDVEDRIREKMQNSSSNDRAILEKALEVLKY